MNNKRKYCFTLDLRKPWGISPLLFGGIQIGWALLTLICYFGSYLNGYGNFELTLIIGLVPSYGLAAFEIHRWLKWGWLINPIGNASSTNKMIVLSKPAYRTVFGYMRREIAPSFDIYRMSDGSYEIRPHANGCPNFNTDFLNALLKELPSYIVYVKRGFPWIIGVESKNKGGKHLQDDNFL